ncbi:hypothetical protein MMF93_07025 [Streptomyces tubbatahanensis]|uniref:Uncharacterized protein n=1 Tax=Streptomyces tubbatahanensis TaxID=2923272 RepID=A0ABY3XPZ2_9ACTN|nr:hypothetical protein [Streptomyces tubbatahanensis]UNS96278.1 hypothetical protein MMF93_07025 [Streptomyces tubbatahanensis]
MLTEPRSGRLAAWGNALFAGLVSPDEAAERIVAGDAVHRVALPDEEGAPVGLTLALGRLRSLGAVGLRVALPVPGHPLGLSGPPQFNARAVAAEEAVLVHGAALGLVPAVHEAGPQGADPEDVHTEVVWECLPVREAPPADVPSLAEAERELAEALREATEVLTRLDVAGSGPVADAALEAYRARMEAGRQLLAPGYPPRAVRVLELAQRVGALVAIAYGGGGDGREHGGALSASAIAARAEALRPVERTARRAQVAAYNAYAEELERRREGGRP